MQTPLLGLATPSWPRLSLPLVSLPLSLLSGTHVGKADERVSKDAFVEYFACEASWLALMASAAFRKDRAAEPSLAGRPAAHFSRGEHQCMACRLRAGRMAGHVCGATSCMQGSVLGLSANAVPYITCVSRAASPGSGCQLTSVPHLPLTISLKLSSLFPAICAISLS